MWFESSTVSHKGHIPSPGPLRLSTSTPEGTLPLIHCHKNILILSGSLMAQTAVIASGAVDGALAWYEDLVEKRPEGSRCQDMLFEALSRHIGKLNRRVNQLRSELVQVEDAKGQGDEELYAKLDSAYSSEDEDVEDEDDEAYLRSFDNPIVRATVDENETAIADSESSYSNDDDSAEDNGDCDEDEVNGVEYSDYDDDEDCEPAVISAGDFQRNLYSGCSDGDRLPRRRG
uniref:Uncharacterized protein n=1 Tax=Aegilops tauschii TaxID=37682 RepID=M8BJR9_AEGTA